jgi:hypothetical protein
MKTTVVEADVSHVQEAGMSSFNGTIYEYLQQGDRRLEMTFDSLLYLLDNDVSNSDSLLKFKEMKGCLQDEQGEYTLLAAPDSCFVNALDRLNRYRGLKDPENNDTLSLTKLLTYRKEIDRYDELNPTIVISTDVYEYKYHLEAMACRYVLSGRYDTETIEATFGEGQIMFSLFHDYRMYLACRRLPASGLVGAGIKELTYYDMLNTLQQDEWMWTKAVWMDIHAKNGVIHVLTPSHEFGYGQFIENFKNYGYEK